MVKVCDAVMGAGKSSATITYINEHPDKKYIYITPYLDEATRIKKACPALSFREPEKKSEHHGSKTLHTKTLVERGRNISTTHRAFAYYSHELLDLIKGKGYTLIIDENVDVMEPLDEDVSDVQLIIDAGYIEEAKNGVYRLAKDVYKGKKHSDLFKMLKSRDLIKTTNEDGSASYYFWRFPPELITAFDEVFILTYLFDGQAIRHFLKLNDIPYEHIGVEYTDAGIYRFCESLDYAPAYVKELKKKIHILDNPKLNSIGNDYFALSGRWFDKPKSDIPQLKSNLYNYFRHICPSRVEDKMWGTFADAEYSIRGKGYSKSYLVFNMKATNKYGGRTVLAYCSNVFMNVGQKIFYHNNGIEVDEDIFALSTLIQWIWRSAIRNGEEIWIYIPSRRMRELLIGWIDEVSGGGNHDK